MVMDEKNNKRATTIVVTISQEV